MRYYVYALIDPRDGNRPFYIGKGMDNRLQSHFKQELPANQLSDESAVIGCDTRWLCAGLCGCDGMGTPQHLGVRRRAGGLGGKG